MTRAWRIYFGAFALLFVGLVGLGWRADATVHRYAYEIEATPPRIGLAPKPIVGSATKPVIPWVHNFPGKDGLSSTIDLSKMKVQQPTPEQMGDYPEIR